MTVRALHTGLPDRTRIRDALDRRLGIDARSLAAFRILLGLTLLFDALHRSQDLVAFYTDAGALPRDLRLEESAWTAEYSLHMLSGEPWFQGLLFGLAAVFAVALVAGYRTRLVALLSLILLVSVQLRNPMVTNGADRLLWKVVLLALFLPLGTRWAIDARGDDREGDPLIATPATAAALVYVVAFFANNGQHKRAGDTWPSGEALQYALRQDHMTILLGDYVAEYPLLLEIGTYGWFVLVVGAPLLLVLTGWLRAAYAGLFLGAVAGLGLTMSVGLFPGVLAAMLVLFVPPCAWDRLEALGASLCRRVEALDRLRARGGELGSRVGPPRRLRSALPPRARDLHGEVWSIVLGCVLIFVVLWCVGLLGYAEPFEPVDSLDAGSYQWSMYAPDPSTSYGWYEVEAQLETGERMDVLRNEELRGEPQPPPEAAATMPNFRWRKYMYSLRESDERADRFAAYMCDRAAEQFDGSVERVEVTYYNRAITLDGEEVPPPATITRAEATCGP